MNEDHSYKRSEHIGTVVEEPFSLKIKNEIFYTYLI
jgi:hypothetical protein